MPSWGYVTQHVLQFRPAGIQRQVDLIEDLAAVLLHHVAHDAVRFAGVDVVGTDQEESCPAVLQKVRRQLHAVLVRNGAGVDDVGRILEAFLEGAVPQQRVVALDDRPHGLAAGRA